MIFFGFRNQKSYVKFHDFITFKFNDDYKHILWAEKRHLYPFEENCKGLDPLNPLYSSMPGLNRAIFQITLLAAVSSGPVYI